MRAVLLMLTLWSGFVRAEGCPGVDDEPAFTLKTKAGPTLNLCGFEDHEIKAEKGRRAFSEFTVYALPKAGATPEKIFASEGGDTHWARVDDKGTLELEELWFFADRPHPAIERAISCADGACRVAATKCVLLLKRGIFPKSLATLEKRLKNKKPVGEDGEDLLDEVWAAALSGDKKALAFYEAEPAAGLDSTLVEVFNGNRAKLKLAQGLSCPAAH